MLELLLIVISLTVVVGIFSWAVYLSLGLWPLRHRLKILVGLLVGLALLGYLMQVWGL